IGDVEQVARNAALEGLLAQAQWTPEELAERLNALAAMLELGIQLNPRTPQRWVSGRAGRPAPPVPREPWPGLVCLLLHRQSGQPVTPEMLGWPSGRGLRHVQTDGELGRIHDGAGAIAALGEVVEADTSEPGYSRTSSEVNPTDADSWSLDEVRVTASARPRQLNPMAVESMEQITRSQRRLSAALGAMTLPPVRETLRLVVNMLRNYLYSEEAGRRLYALAVELGRLAGWLAFDSEQPELARRYLLPALLAAQASGDHAAGVDILGVLSVVAESPRLG
ncbi:MAG: hypothetical protein ACRD0H_16065, partial [Actinomycetes bacterium]